MATYETILEATVKAGVEYFGGFPSGTMIAFAGKSVPDGWLLCNGALVSRRTYAKLFAAIGTAWGAGDGSTTFKLPNADGRVMQGVTDASKVGKYLEAGLPNIIGGISAEDVNQVTMDSEFSGTGAFRCHTGTVAAAGSYGKYSGFVGFTFDASQSNAAYSKSTTVQPKALQTLIIIKF